VTSNCFSTGLPEIWNLKFRPTAIRQKKGSLRRVSLNIWIRKFLIELNQVVLLLHQEQLSGNLEQRSDQ
jgi:hypothetical protein